MTWGTQAGSLGVSVRAPLARERRVPPPGAERAPLTEGLRACFGEDQKTLPALLRLTLPRRETLVMPQGHVLG